MTAGECVDDARESETETREGNHTHNNPCTDTGNSHGQGHLGTLIQRLSKANDGRNHPFYGRVQHVLGTPFGGRPDI